MENTLKQTSQLYKCCVEHIRTRIYVYRQKCVSTKNIRIALSKKQKKGLGPSRVTFRHKCNFDGEQACGSSIHYRYILRYVIDSVDRTDFGWTEPCTFRRSLSEARHHSAGIWFPVTHRACVAAIEPARAASGDGVFIFACARRALLASHHRVETDPVGNPCTFVTLRTVILAVDSSSGVGFIERVAHRARLESWNRNGQGETMNQCEDA